MRDDTVLSHVEGADAIFAEMSVVGFETRSKDRLVNSLHTVIEWDNGLELPSHLGQPVSPDRDVLLCPA